MAKFKRAFICDSCKKPHVIESDRNNLDKLQSERIEKCNRRAPEMYLQEALRRLHGIIKVIDYYKQRVK